jgi:hypothetical protein
LRAFRDREAAHFLLLGVTTHSSLYVRIALTAGLLFSASSARAQAAELGYEAPAGCPSESDFTRAVRGRGATFDAAVTKTRLEVLIRRDEAGFGGSLVVRKDAGPPSRREVHGASCAEVANALAVVSAIALRAEPEPVSGPPPAPSSEPEPPAPPPTPTETPPAAAPAPAPAPPPRAPLRAKGLADGNAEVAAGSLTYDKAFVANFSAGVNLGMVPSVALPRYDLTVTRTNFVSTPEGHDYVAGPIIRVRASYLGKVTRRSSDTETEVSGFSTGIGTCYAPFYDTRGLVLMGCAEFAAGLLGFDTKSVTDGSIVSKASPLATTSLGIDFAYNIGSVVHVGAKAGTEMVLGTLSAQRNDGSEIFRSSLFTGYALLGAGGQF